ncbi:hypothetical protein [Candidatus Sodalis pierantonius]|uniref:hypothetical protein n=1 Tax=Candidatus Sodalis pierantonii TaxID=1486991 RepID=UPI0004BC464A|nr:hypothetical protein [Candidatus Sodalis pierantonius]
MRTLSLSVSAVVSLFSLFLPLAAKPLVTGTAVNFSFRLQNGSYTVTAIQPVQP